MALSTLLPSRCIGLQLPSFPASMATESLVQNIALRREKKTLPILKEYAKLLFLWTMTITPL